MIVSAGIDQGFKLTLAQLEQALTARTRLLVINSPSNPTGAVYTHAELSALGQVLRRHADVLIASDGMYEHIRRSDQSFCNIARSSPNARSC